MEDLVGFCYFLPKSKGMDSGDPGRGNDRTAETTIKKKVVKDLLVGYHIDAKRLDSCMNGLYENIEKHNKKESCFLLRNSIFSL